MTESLSFEETFQRLEASVRRLEEGGLALEEAIALYEESTVLASQCRDLLDGAELRIQQLHERMVDTPLADDTVPTFDEPEARAAPSLFDRLGGAGA